MLLERIGPPAEGPRVNLLCHPYAREGCYGVARQRDGSRQNSTGVSGVLSLRHFGLAGSLYPLARGCRTIWRGEVLVYWFRRRDAARPDRAAWAVQAARWKARWRRRRRFRFIDFRAPR